MSTTLKMHWNFEHVARLYQLVGMTRDYKPTNLMGEGEQTLGHSRLSFDFGYPDIRSRGEIKSDYFMRMLAAAPEMLKVLQELDECASYWSHYDVPIGIHDRIKAAIAKANGETL